MKSKQQKEKNRGLKFRRGISCTQDSNFCQWHWL